MTSRYSMDEIQQLLKIPDNPSPKDDKIMEFFQLYNKATRTEVKGDGPCSPDEDCSDLLSECCSAILTTVFGTLPLEVKCTACGQCYVLREILASEKGS